MVRSHQFTNGTGRSGAALYFVEQLSVSDYYRDGVGILQGAAYDHVGLTKREVDLDVFRAIEANTNPETGKRLTPRTNTTREEWGVDKNGKPELKKVPNRRTGMDLTMIVPKTVSEVWLENYGSEFANQIYAAFITSKTTAMNFAESLAKTRVRIGGVEESRVTGNLLYLSVIHNDARPTGSQVPDPLLHAHNYIFNLTWDPVEQRLKAVDLHSVISHAETIDAVFISTLERELNKLGIGTERTADGRGFEITNALGKEIFSKRRDEILKLHYQEKGKIEVLTKMEIRKAAQMGKTLDYDRVKTKVRNRLAKRMAHQKIAITMDDKLAALRAQMTPDIRKSLQPESVIAGERKNWQTPDEAKQMVLFSAFKNYSVVHELEIVAQLLRATGGRMTLPEALEYARSDAFIKLDEDGHVTTRPVEVEELAMLAVVRNGWDGYQPAAPDWEIKDKVLALDQLRAVKFILNSHDFMMDVSGIAGSGKTTLLKETVKALKSKGINAVMLAPTSASEKKLHEDFPAAMTIQKFDINKLSHTTIPRGTFIFVDEISMVSVPQLARLVSYAEEGGWRIVTLGDVDQHVSPERGDAIRILQESKSVRSTALTETYRAKVKYLKQCVIDLKAGGMRREVAFERMNVHGDIREIEDSGEMREAAIRTHLESVRQGHVSILACPVHAEARQVADMVRTTLKAEGGISGVDHTVKRLQRIDAEGPELKDLRHYQPDRIVIFRSNVAGGFRSGQKWRVIEMGRGVHAGKKLLLEKVDGNFNRGLFSPQDKGNWNVYDAQEMQVSVGDQIRVTEGFSSVYGDKFKNNDIGKVKDINRAGIILEDGRVMDRDLVHIDQGVCITSYATQCRTVRQVVALAPILSFAEMSAKTFYVLASRCTHSFVLFTDCKEALRDAVLRPGTRRAVWDYQQFNQIQQTKGPEHEQHR